MILQCNNHVASFTREEALQDKEYLPHGNVALQLPAGVYTFVYDYPLSRVATFTEALFPLTTLIDILLLGRTHYEAIYAAEARTSKDPGRVPGLLNRARSTGSYGIWGHDLSDLYFESVEINPKTKHIEFGIGS